MTAYVLRRLLYSIPIFFGVTLITFLLFNVVGGDPAITLAGKHATERRIEEVRRELGTGRSLPRQYADFLGQIATLDFGKSWSAKRPVSSVVADGVVPSLSLAVPAFFLETLLAIAFGLLCAFYRGSAVDYVTIVVTAAMVSVPGLAYIIFGQYFLAYQWKLFPIFGYQPPPLGIVFLGLPILIWIALTAGSEIRFYRTVMLEEMRQDYVRTAAAKGLRTSRILYRHVLKNSMIQVITRVVIAIPFLMLGSLLLEVFFGIPGLGYRTYDALNQGDQPVIKAMTVIGSLLYIVFSILTDVCYALVDPRVRLK